MAQRQSSELGCYMSESKSHSSWNKQTLGQSVKIHEGITFQEELVGNNYSPSPVSNLFKRDRMFLEFFQFVF